MAEQATKTRSKRYATVLKWYRLGRWPESAVREAVAKDWITQGECDEILGLADGPTATGEGA